ncbi:MAG TPA: DNA translocase FtsK [Firmicutes bacterium]|jgi:S-DNA-T family DNA segregation ATPase FtsK/SpoIIIE|nr:DNA translocase FtsK [Bacillota bacterium]
MAAKKTGKKNKTEKRKKDTIRNQVKAIVFIAAAVFLFVCIQFTDQTGLLGTVMNLIFKTVLGEAALALPFFFLVVSLGYFWPYRIENLKYRLLGLIIVFGILTISLHLRIFLQEPVVDGKSMFSCMMELGLLGRGGGLLGALLTAFLFFLFRDLGSYIVIISLGLIALLLMTNSSLLELFHGLRGIFTFFLNHFKNFSRVLSYGEGKEETKKGNSYKIRDYKSFNAKKEGKEKREENGIRKEGKNDLIVFPEGAEVIQEKKLPEGAEKGEIVGEGRVNNGLPQGLPLGEVPVTTLVPIPGANESYGDYTVPSLALLTRVNKLKDYQQQKLIHERARTLENTFGSFGISVRIKEVQAGPAVTRYEIQPETGVKVSKILGLSDDLALNLAAPDVRIEAPIPGKAAIGIEVPNKIISLVYLREVLEESDFLSSASPLMTGLGKDITGVPVFADLLKMPHLLVAGSTGSGKSVCINSILCSILLKVPPWAVKFLLIDPKIVELSVYNGIPHLISPVVTEAKKAALALRAMVKEMERRYELFAQSGVRDITKYNEAYDMLPYIVVVIDELSDLMMVSPSEVEDSIVRLSQMARAAGIHLVIATQRPSVDVITGLIKANITSRIAFAVSSQIDSRTILDAGGAEKLLGRGDMLYHPIGLHKPLRVQGAFISENDISKVVDYIKQQESPLYQHAFLAEEETVEEVAIEKTDVLLPEATDLIFDVGYASISLIQRRFRIGYNRAARIIDDLERFGIVGKFEGSKPRQLLIGAEQAKGILEEKVGPQQ